MEPDQNNKKLSSGEGARVHQSPVTVNETDASINSLDNITTEIRHYARTTIPFLTIVHILILVLLLGLPQHQYITGLYAASFALLVTAIQGFAIYNFVRFDGLIRDGDVYFHEISDQLEWYSKTSDAASVSISQREVRFRTTRARLVLRQYVSDAHLPLVKGRSGILIYGLMNFLIYIGIIILIRLWYVGAMQLGQ